MKKVSTFILAISFCLAGSFAMAQSVEKQAEIQTKEMVSKLHLNEADYLKLKKMNIDRLEKIAGLANLREQDNRYLDLRLDQIEEEYASMLYNTLNQTQYAAFMNYKKDQPYTYAAVASKNNLNNLALEVEK